MEDDPQLPGDKPDETPPQTTARDVGRLEIYAYIGLMILLVANLFFIVTTQKQAAFAFQELSVSNAMLESVRLAPPSAVTERLGVLNALHQLRFDFAFSASRAGAMLFVFSFPLMLALLSGVLPGLFKRPIVLCAIGITLGLLVVNGYQEGQKLQTSRCYIGAIEAAIDARDRGEMTDAQIFEIERQIEASCRG